MLSSVCHLLLLLLLALLCGRCGGWWWFWPCTGLSVGPCDTGFSVGPYYTGFSTGGRSVQGPNRGLLAYFLFEGWLRRGQCGASCRGGGAHAREKGDGHSFAYRVWSSILASSFLWPSYSCSLRLLVCVLVCVSLSVSLSLSLSQLELYIVVQVAAEICFWDLFCFVLFGAPRDDLCRHTLGNEKHEIITLKREKMRLSVQESYRITSICLLYTSPSPRD